MVMHHDGGAGGVGSLYYSDILFSLPQASDALYKVTLMDWLMGSLFAQPHGRLHTCLLSQVGSCLSMVEAKKKPLPFNLHSLSTCCSY